MEAKPFAQTTFSASKSVSAISSFLVTHPKALRPYKSGKQAQFDWKLLAILTWTAAQSSIDDLE